MAAKQSKSTRTFVRHVAPFAPLALSLMMNANGRPSPRPTGGGSGTGVGSSGIVAEKCQNVVDFHDCHNRYPTGCSGAGKYDAYLNNFKNDLIPPPAISSSIVYLTKDDYAQLDASIPTGLTQNNQSGFQDRLSQLGEGETRGVIGYLNYFEYTGAESSNCEMTGPSGDAEYGNVDYHIGIGFEPGMAESAGAGPHVEATAEAKRHPTGGTSGGSSTSSATPAQQNSVIVEMTPHYRFQYGHNIWTLENLKKAQGRQVRVIGQLLIDNEHNLPSENCATAQTAAEKQSCWRMSVWELHPVEHFQVCQKTTNDCTADDDTNWLELDQL